MLNPFPGPNQAGLNRGLSWPSPQRLDRAAGKHSYMLNAPLRMQKHAYFALDGPVYII